MTKDSPITNLSGRIHCEKYFTAIVKTIRVHVEIYLADFLKTNPAKFAAWLKKGQKARFLCPISSKITLAKKKGKENWTKRGRGGRKEEKGNKQWLHSIFSVMATLETEKKKNRLTEEGVYLAQTFSKIRLAIYIKKLIFGYLVFQLLKSSRKGC